MKELVERVSEGAGKENFCCSEFVTEVEEGVASRDQCGRFLNGGDVPPSKTGYSEDTVNGGTGGEEDRVVSGR